MDWICKILNAYAQEVPLQHVLDTLAKLGCLRPWQSVGMALHYSYISLKIKEGVPYLRCERQPIPVL